MKWMLLSATSAEGLSEEVNSKLRQGWKLYGPPSCSMSESELERAWIFIQAITRGDSARGSPAKRKDKNE